MATYAEVTFFSPHGGSGWELGSCLWSPERAEPKEGATEGADRYAIMRRPVAGDVVLHWVGYWRRLS